MPKEFIHSRDFGRMVPTIVGDGSTGEVEMSPLDNDAIKVGWSKEAEHVEIAVCQTVDGAFVEHGFLYQVGAEPTVADALLTPRYIQMDRAGLNRLIRTLRKARDDAFGSDA